jgi:hypothetical protein
VLPPMLYIYRRRKVEIAYMLSQPHAGFPDFREGTRLLLTIGRLVPW